MQEGNNLIGVTFFVTLVALMVTALVFPKVLWFAKKHNIMDNPNARKLQRTPVPVMGGIAVYIGVLIGFMILAYLYTDPIILISLLAMTVMQKVGIWMISVIYPQDSVSCLRWYLSVC